MNRATNDIFRILVSLPPDLLILAVLVCLLLWGAHDERN